MADFRRGVAMLQDCFPARLSVIYVLHEPRWLNMLVRLLRPLLRKPTLQQKFRLCGSDYAQLHEQLPAHALPAQLACGGSLAFDWGAQLDAWQAEEALAAPVAAAFDPMQLVEAAGRAEQLTEQQRQPEPHPIEVEVA